MATKAMVIPITRASRTLPTRIRANGPATRAAARAGGMAMKLLTTKAAAINHHPVADTVPATGDSKILAITTMKASANGAAMATMVKAKAAMVKARAAMVKVKVVIVKARAAMAKAGAMITVPKLTLDRTGVTSNTAITIRVTNTGITKAGSRIGKTG